ncbi:MAG: STAS domain-containing protein [Ignavibacteriae bacterium]|nr:anti-sigma factor antagonist [Ignavibacteriota bacterium]NOG99172.1 STAS domain-containing protein [Ignavibacteriota bacterium]
MKFNTSEVYNAAVFSFKGKLMGGPEAQGFHDKLDEFLSAGKKNIIVDMSDVKFVNSSGLGNIVRGFTTVKDAGGQMKLTGATEKIDGLLSITKLNSVFEQHKTIEDAAQSF